MKSVQLKWLEDIIIASLLTKGKLISDTNGRYIVVNIEPRKERVLHDYLHRYKLEDRLVYNETSKQLIIPPSLMLERIVRDWIEEGCVTTLDPTKLRLNTFFLLVALFGIKKKGAVTIPTSLGKEQQYTLAILYKKMFDSEIYPGSEMMITSFSPILLKAYKINRSIEETLELSFLLPEKEKVSIKQLIIEWEEETTQYAY